MSKYDGAEFNVVGVKPVEQPSPFDEFKATLVDVEVRIGPNRFEPDKMTRNLVFKWKLDQPIGQYGSHDEEYPLPTDPKTGEPLVDKEGNEVAPYSTSKWARQRGLFTPIGIPWEEVIAGLIGIHGTLQQKGSRLSAEDRAAGKRPNRSDFPFGKYLVAWDYYDNTIRKQEGLNPITDTYESVVAEARGTDDPAEAISDEDGYAAAAEIADGRTYIQYVQEVKKRPELARFANREALNFMTGEGGLLVSVTVDNKTKYQLK